MGRWLRVSGLIDRFNERVGQTVAWLALVMVLLGTFNAVGRYAGRFIGINLSSNLYLELQWYLFSLLFLLGGAWVLRDDAHVRVDVVYARFSTRTRGWINFVGMLTLLIPFCIFAFWSSIPAVRNSWAVREASPDPGGLPRYHLKTVILVCFALLIIQGISEAIKAFAATRKGASLPPGASAREAEADATLRHEGHGGAL